jgi:hypothetical protein
MASLIRPISSTTAAVVGSRRFACASSASKAKLSSSVQFGSSNPAWRRHISCHHHGRTNINNGGFRKRRAFSTNNSSSTSGKGKGSSQVKDKQPSKSSKQKSTTGSDAESPSIEQQLATLQAEIAHLSYLIKQTSTQQLETASLSRRAEARSYIIEHKLMDIQSHVVKIPEMEHLTKSLRQYLEKYSPSLISDAFLQRTSSGAKDAFINKYTIWATLTAIILFWRYRVTMYQRTSEEVADIAAMTLQQDTLRCQIQETLATVANSPSTLASLSSLFQQLISEERTQQHLIDLIVRALGSEGVRLAAVQLLDVCFQNEELQRRAGEFLKVAAKVAVLDEGVQKSAGVGIQQALKSAVLQPWWVVKSLETTKGSDDGGGGSGQKDDDGNVERSNDDAVVVNGNGRE